MNRSVCKKRLSAALPLLALLICLSACADKPSRSELQERLDADVSQFSGDPSSETLSNEPVPDEPPFETPVPAAEPESPDTPETPDAPVAPVETGVPAEEDGVPSDEELRQLLTDIETGLTGANTFTFRSASELTGDELYLSFLLLTPHDDLNRCWDAEAERFYFTEDYIVSELSKYYRDFYFDIRQNADYSVDARAIVTPLASGFGGGRNIVIEEAAMQDDTLTVTAAFYDMLDETHAPENCRLRKIYTLERYDGGWYFLSAIEQPLSDCAEPETAALLLTMLRRAQIVNLPQDDRYSYTQQADYRTAYEAYQQYFTAHAAEYTIYAQAEDAWMSFYWLEGGLSCFIHDKSGEVQLLYRPSSGVIVISDPS